MASRHTPILVLALATAAACGTKSAPSPPAADSGADLDSGMSGCGALAQPCCAESNCNSGLSCSGGACQVSVDAASDGGCGAFVACSGVCTDLRSNPNACGACGHSCAGMECTAGICSPVLVASGLTGAMRMTLDAKNVYWTSAGDGTVQSVPKVGGGVSILATGIAAPYGIGVNATSLYFTSEGTAANSFTDGAVFALGLAKGSMLVTLASARKRPRQLRLDGANVYWLDQGIATGDGALVACALGGCANNPTLLAGPLADPYGLAIDGTSAYYSEIMAGSVKSIPLAGGMTPTPLGLGQDQPNGVAVDAKNVYWADFDDGSLQSAPIKGGGSNTLATAKGYPQDIVTDGTYVYFTDTKFAPGEGAVMRCPVAGCAGSPLPLAGGTPSALDLAVDDTYVYWLGSDGTVMRAAK